jgi:hypothetical protein
LAWIIELVQECALRRHLAKEKLVDNPVPRYEMSAAMQLKMGRDSRMSLVWKLGVVVLLACTARRFGFTLEKVAFDSDERVSGGCRLSAV